MRIRQLNGLQWTMLAAIAIVVLPWAACIPGGFQFPSFCLPGPTLTTISPVQVKAGSPEFALQVTGKDFHSASYLTINGQQRTTMIGGEHELSALIEPADVAQPGIAKIVVVTPPPKDGCGGGISKEFTLTITP